MPKMKSIVSLLLVSTLASCSTQETEKLTKQVRNNDEIQRLLLQDFKKYFSIPEVYVDDFGKISKYLLSKDLVIKRTSDKSFKNCVKKGDSFQSFAVYRKNFSVNNNLYFKLLVDSGAQRVVCLERSAMNRVTSEAS